MSTSEHAKEVVALVKRLRGEYPSPAAEEQVACAPVDPGFGDSLRYDMAAQTINPDPVYPATGAKPGSNGEKAADASKKYRKGQTKPVERISANSSGSSGGGSGPQ